eukprot:CAMPEP_0201521816 /NCGR_PEP_ID=MMETSP0161_2-20130828/16286_1 /ASSEMBLY_ACC=CAM_ASM_000251 /TAXON_ID=180227 /ORGANISM="Neoparamoeba aestuarina, Strain SoJaBio B1-5/56/2" /LENGTH=289 /DNA_ID=CAMNT_0047920527 /DNA_START=94 /DNA_END=960 /DNA_ORIENTATION=-
MSSGVDVKRGTKKKDREIVGSPQNVTHLAGDKSGEVGGDDKREWFRKYKSKKLPKQLEKKEGNEKPVVSDKQKAQAEMALLCLHQDKGAQEHGLKVLINLTLQPGFQQLVTDAIPTLTTLMDSPSHMVQIFSTYVLANAALDPVNQPKVREAGGVIKAVGFLRGGGLEAYNPEIIEKALWLLTNVTKEKESRAVVVKEGGLEIMVGLLGSLQVSVVTHTIRVLRNLSFEVETQQLLAELGGVEVLLRMHANQKLSGVIDNLRYEWTNLVCVLGYYRTSIGPLWLIQRPC